MTSPQETSGRYVASAGSVAAGLVIRLALSPVLGSTVPYITFFPAVMVAAWFGGLKPGILATVACLFAAFYFVIPPIHRFLPFTVEDAIGAILFAGVSAFILTLSEALRRSRAVTEQRLRELTLETAWRSQVERELEESKLEAERRRDLLQTTLSSVADAVVATDLEGGVTFLNAVARTLTGWSETDAAGKPVSEVVVIRNGLLITRTGSQIAIENSTAPIQDERHNVLGAVLVFRDVTGRRAVENEIARSEERLKLALDAGQIGVWDWDVIHDRIEWSDRVYEIHGVPRAQFGGAVEEYTKLIHPEDRQRVSRAISEALQPGVPYEIEFRVIRPDGAVRWVSTRGLVFRNEKGEPIRMLGATTDVTERKEAEANLRQQWHTFDTALSHTPDFTYTFDLEGRFTYVNRALLSLWNKTLEEAIGKNFFELGYPPELAGRLQRQIRQVIETKDPLRDHTPFTGPDGEARDYEYIFVPVLAPDGHVNAVAGSTRDVTERSRAEEALRTSEERLTFALAAGGGIGTWDWDIQRDRVYCNPPFAKLFSVDPERGVAGTSFSEFFASFHPDDQGRIDKSIRHAIQTGEDYAEEYRVVQPDGSIRWVYAHGRCHLDEAGRATRFPGVVFDITDRKHAEQRLRESQERLRAIYDGTYEYIGLLAPDGTLLEANRASLEFAGNTREDIVGRPFWDTPWFTATPGAPEAVRDGVARAAAGEFVRFEAAVRRPSGECPVFDISFHPIRNDRGEVVLIVPEGRDITDLKRAETELRRSNEELIRANRELEEFSYVASHDLQEPLRMVNIYTQLILRDSAGDKDTLNEYGRFVRDGVARMEVLIHDLLAFSRTVHTERGTFETADLSIALREALCVLKGPLEESGAVVRAENLPAVRGNTAQMAHVFQNLVANALKYRRPDVPVEIHIAAGRQGDNCVVSVRDNGIGFEQQYAERIFGLFKRLHKDEYPGTGLGLAICQRIVERYGGRVWAEGRPGEGSTFWFALPSADQ